MDSALAVRSRQLYTKSWALFQTFHRGCYHQDGVPPMPTQVVVQFVSYLDLQGYARSTIRSHLSAIAYPHKMAGLQDPTEQFIVRKVIKTVGNKATNTIEKHPITLVLLGRLVDVGPLHLSLEESIIFKAVYTLAFHACARLGELVCADGPADHTVRRSQIVITNTRQSTPSFTITFKTYKHSGPDNPVTRVIHPTHRNSCPVRAMLAYLHLRGPNWSRRSDPNQYLFTWATGKPVTTRQVSQALQKGLTYIGVQPGTVSPHGFRIGGTTEAALQGASDTQLRLLGRWGSSAFLKYVRPRVFSHKY